MFVCQNKYKFAEFTSYRNQHNQVILANNHKLKISSGNITNCGRYDYNLMLGSIIILNIAFMVWGIAVAKDHYKELNLVLGALTLHIMFIAFIVLMMLKDFILSPTANYFISNMGVLAFVMLFVITLYICTYGTAIVYNNVKTLYGIELKKYFMYMWNKYIMGEDVKPLEHIETKDGVVVSRTTLNEEHVWLVGLYHFTAIFNFLFVWAADSICNSFDNKNKVYKFLRKTSLENRDIIYLNNTLNRYNEFLKTNTNGALSISRSLCDVNQFKEWFLNNKSSFEQEADDTNDKDYASFVKRFSQELVIVKEKVA